MKPGFRVVLVSALLAAAPLAWAQTPPAAPAPIIGVVDVDEIQQESAAAKAVRAQAAKYRQDFQSQGSAEEAALRAAQQAIEQERKTLPPQDLAEKARAFDASVAEYQKRELARRRAFEKSFNIAMTKVQQAMFEATRQVAMTHGANVILPRGQVLLFDDKMNMTKEIIALMDKALPTADFPPPVLEGEAAQPAQPAKKKN
jgi:Skp family chaperone for outer membrane proteins